MLGLGTFSLDVQEELGERLSFCVTFLLADVATLQLMFQQLPNIPYWTVMDMYMYGCFLFLFVITIWTCLAGAFEFLGERDKLFFFISGGIWLLCQLSFVGKALQQRREEKKKLSMSDRELDDFFGNRNSACDRRSITNEWNGDVAFEEQRDEKTLCWKNGKKAGGFSLWD